MRKCPEDIEKLAKLIAYWHGQKVLFIHPVDGKVTVAGFRDNNRSGFPEVTDRYTAIHWEEYTSAAERVKEHFNAARTTNPPTDGQPEPA
jgi:hypothetical protein